MNTVQLSIPSISCGHCVHTIQTELLDLEGVKTVEANAESKEVAISFEPPTDKEQIISLLKEINYPPV